MKVIKFKKIISLSLAAVLMVLSVLCTSSCGTNINRLAKKVQGKVYVFDHMDQIITPEPESALSDPKVSAYIEQKFASYESEFKTYTLISDVFGEMSIYVNNYCKAHGQIMEETRNVCMTSYSTYLDFHFSKNTKELDAYIEAFTVKPENQHVEYQVDYHVYFKLEK